MKQKSFLLAGIVLFLIVFNNVCFADLILQPGPEGKDSCEYTDYRGYPYNHGSAEYLTVYKFEHNGGYGTTDTYIEFDLSGIFSSNIQSASLQLYVYPNSNVIISNIWASRITEAWDEMTILENNTPGFSTDGQVFNDNEIQRATWVTWDITNMVIDWTNGTYENHGVMLRTSDVTYNSNAMSFYSSDYTSDPSLRPKLVITGNPVPSPNTIWSLGLGLFFLIGLKRNYLMKQ